MTIREQIVAEARTWIGTPYVDHSGIKGVGVDCAFFPTRVLQSVGVVPKSFKPPRYSPQQWMVRGVDGKVVEDTTYLDALLKFAKREVLDQKEVKPGDLVLYQLFTSWTHGAIVVEWPRMLLHPIKVRGVIGSQADEGMLRLRPRRFFSFVEGD